VKRVFPVVVVVLATACSLGGSQQPAEEGRSISGAGPSVAEWEPDECPPNWPGPWTACPEADWVRRIAETAGYRVTGDTGSALTAEGRGDGFYIWATPMPEEHRVATAAREDWARRGRVEGVEVFGDDQWRWWPAQGFVVWLHAGPSAEATLPSLREMTPLVRASLDLPPPE
jgi:hypothetical protein